MKCSKLVMLLLLGVVVSVAVGVGFFIGLQSRESASDTANNESLVDRNTTKEDDDKSSLLDKKVTKESGDNSSLVTKETDEKSSLVDRNMTKETDEKSSLVDRNMTKESDKNSSLVDRKYVDIMDVSQENFPISNETKPPTKTAYEKSLRFGSIVNKTVEKLNDKRFHLLLSNLSSFNDPDYKSDSGVKAAEWLISQLIQTIQNNSDYPRNVTIKRFLHSWKQPSVIVRFEGTDPALKSQLVLLGAELDTQYENNSTAGPGDNVGGSAALLETTRVLLEANFIPKRSIELHWYASGEDIEKQRGETEIAQCYTKSGVNVISMVKFDTICYYLKDVWKPLGYEVNKATKKRLWESQADKTDNPLAEFLVTVEETFQDWRDRLINIRCRTKGCYSDKTSWSAYGVNVAWPIVYPCLVQFSFNDYLIALKIHRALYLAKMATIYAVEMAMPKNVKK